MHKVTSFGNSTAYLVRFLAAFKVILIEKLFLLFYSMSLIIEKSIQTVTSVLQTLLGEEQ